MSINDDICVHVDVTRRESNASEGFDEISEVSGIEEARIIVWKPGTIYSWTSRP